MSLLADAVAEKLEHEHGVLLTKASDIHGDGGASVTPSLATDAGLENAAALLEVGEDAKLALAVALARQPVTQEIAQAAVRAVHASLKAAAAAADGDDDDDACAALRSCTAVGTLGAHATGRRSFGLLNAVNAAARGAANVRLQALVGSSEMRSAEKDAESDAALARACALATVRASAARHGDAKEAAAVAILEHFKIPTAYIDCIASTPHPGFARRLLGYVRWRKLACAQYSVGMKGQPRQRAWILRTHLGTMRCPFSPPWAA